MTWLHAPVWLACTAFALACARQAPAPPTDTETSVCQGTRMLVVRNNTGHSMDIVESRIGSGARDVVATVGPGRHEMTIRNGYSYHARPSPGVRLGPARSRQDVTLDHVCR